MTSAGSQHVGACGAAGPGKGEPPGRGRCRRARQLDVSPPLHSQAPPEKAPEAQPAPPVASGDEGDEATRTWAVQGGGTERGGAAVGRSAGRGPAPCSQNTPGTAGKTDGPLGGQDAGSDRGPGRPQAGQDPAGRLAGVCGRPSAEDTRHVTQAVRFHAPHHPASRRPSAPPPVGSSSGRRARPGPVQLPAAHQGHRTPSSRAFAWLRYSAACPRPSCCHSLRCG